MEKKSAAPQEGLDVSIERAWQDGIDLRYQAPFTARPFEERQAST
jgi:hypothetical protein